VDKGRTARRADDLAAIYEPIVLKTWEPRRLHGAALFIFSCFKTRQDLTVTRCENLKPYKLIYFVSYTATGGEDDGTRRFSLPASVVHISFRPPLKRERGEK
jgi:hypothetical protein